MKPEDINLHDAGGMHKVYERWPEIAAESYGAHERMDLGDINRVVFAGMGGSGTVGDVFASILSKTGMRVSSVKGYVLPEGIDSGTLVVATSVSGNTDETFAVLEEAARSDCTTVAASSGGRMERFCSSNGISHIKIDETHSPRASLVGYLYSLIGSLGSVLPVGESDVKGSIDTMQKTRGMVSTGNLDGDNPSLNLAEWISGIPVIYYPFGLQSVAVRFKNCLQENAKIHAMTEDVIEACHNGVVSWERESDCQPVLIRGADDHPRTRERWDVLEKYFGKRGISPYTVSSVKGGILSKIVNLVYVLDYASIYLAAISGVDPTPVESVDYIKSNMRAGA